MSNHYGKLLSITIAGSILLGMPTASAALPRSQLLWQRSSRRPPMPKF